jgi:hypothetical protein
MKFSPLSRPSLVLPAAIGIAALLACCGWRLYSENEALREAQEHPQALAENVQPQSRSMPSAPAKDEAAARARLAELRAELDKETAARTALEAKAAELAATLPTKEDDITVSFGRIEQMGQTSADLVRLFTSDAFKKAAAGKAGAIDIPDDELRQMMSAFQKHMGQVPELQRMEDDSKEIARYHSALLKDIYGLDEAAATKVAAFLETEFAKLKAAGLTVSQRTAEDKASWETQREAAMKDLAGRVQPMLPPSHEQLSLLPGLLNLGEGMRTKVEVRKDGLGGATMMTLPLFPTMPNL